jgi:alanyl-tRNA synthetase
MSELEEAYRLDYFEENGFHRRECPECGDNFWTRDADRETCGEPPCDTYGFIDDPGVEEEYSLAEMSEEFRLIQIS